MKVKLSPLVQIEVIHLPNKGDSKSVLYLGITILKQLSSKVERIREKDSKHFNLQSFNSKNNLLQGCKLKGLFAARASID